MSSIKKIIDCISHGKYISSIDKYNLSWSILLTCEHASNNIPKINNWKWGDNDISNNLLNQHWGIDIGAYTFTMDIIKELQNNNEIPSSNKTNGCLSAICAQFSRLLLDCNRPIGSSTMFRTKCDNNLVDLNKNITEEDKQLRIETLFNPYHNEISNVMKEDKPKVVFSIHSFNPIYEGEKRTMEVGILFDDSSEKLGTMITESMKNDGILAENNQPWSGKEGFMHSAQIHALESSNSLPLMIEVRNDLLEDNNEKHKIVKSLVKALKLPSIKSLCSTIE